MKKFTFLILFTTFSFLVIGQNAWINELHYDNASGDVDEVVEIVIENPGSYLLSDFSVYLYNGSNGSTYDNESVDNFTVGNSSGNFTIYYWNPSSIQNGAPDGLALVYQTAVITDQFLSYEGSFTGTAGPANGLTSADIGVSETGSTPVGQSLQLTGTGSMYSHFSWLGPATNTVGSVNNGQILSSGGNLPPVVTNISNSPLVPLSTETVAVSADVTDTDGSVGAVACYYGTTSGSLTNNIDMSWVSGDTYTTDTDIPVYADGTTVYYEIYALDNLAEATTSPEQNYVVTDPLPEPTNHVASFAAGIPTSSSIALTWLDNDGATPAGGFIIKASTSSTFADPVDGTPEVDDTDMSDGSGQINVASGVEAYTFTGLNLSTEYFFKIWPYTNSGVDIDYKTDGTVPTDSETTTGPPTTALPYNETFDADLGDCYTNSVTGASKEWYWNSSGYAAMNGYNSGDVEEDWLILPGINLDSYSNEFMTFDTWYQFGTDGVDDYLKLMYSTNYSGTGDPTTAAWTELSYTQPASATTWETSGTVDLSTITGTSVHIAYKYHYNPGVYRSWGVDNISIQESSVDPEPTNYPTAFIATTDGASAITNDWTDAIGAQLPAGYLILANLTGTFTAPVDGTPESDDTDLSDGAGAMNIAFGTETYQWTGLEQNTQYFFTIYPYTNAAATIDYKTDGTPPTANETTGIANLDLYISEVADPSGTGSHDHRFVELFNGGATTIDFNSETWYLCRQIAGGNWQDVQLSGTVASGSAFVIASSASNFTAEYGFAPDQSSGSISGTGDDGFFLYKNGGNASGTLIDAFGEINVDGSGEPWEYTDAKAVRLRSVSSPNSTWTASEWDVPGSASRDDMTPSEHKEDVIWQAGGTDPSNWNEKGGNWPGTHGYIPDASFNVTIPTTTVTPAITSEAACAALTVQSGGFLDVNVGGSFDIYGFMTTGSPFGILTVKSDATGNGSLIAHFFPGVATVERYIPAYTVSADGWHQIASPVSTMPIAGSDFDPGANDDLYKWHEPTYVWDNYKDGFLDLETTLESTQGYLVAFETAAVRNFTGVLTTFPTTIPNLSVTAGFGVGWHFLGNPFTSAIEWGTADWALTDVGGVAKIWNDAIGNYSDINPGDIIPSTNGFFVQAANATNSITIPAAARLHDATNNYKNSRIEGDDETLVLRINNDENAFADLARIGFMENATEAWDIAIDAHKFFGGATAPQLWTVSNGEYFSQNYLPYVYEAYQLPLNFRAGVNSTYHIFAEGIESFYPNSEIYLEDLLLDQIINLRDQQMYSFTATTEDDDNRFVLHFYGVTSTGDEPELNTTNIFAQQNTIYIKSAQLPKGTYQVEVFNVIGQQVYAGQLEPSTLSSFTLDEKTGVYVVRVHSENQTFVQKVMIK